ncbi:hypothetical protein BIY24_01395 [Halobacteriovorax marinus]|uniref:transglycosylase SLT domain-containing protein n=1 Tax=Halobacteriovorax marinus TaxID=97084 RepID=UPI000BC3033A|nr:transglycosylase SLT domain-containing protein [Halobacteriovorax marinus]ATH06636.1 hypothetical protein BIY24_01395 [Halobacteriovorax marinus]
MLITNFKKQYLLILILLFSISCKKNGNTQSDIIFGPSAGNDTPYVPSTGEVTDVIEPGVEGENSCPDVRVDSDGNISLPKISPTGWKGEWSKKVISVLENKKEISDSMLKDPNLINNKSLSKINCQGYKYATENERKQFWVTLIAAMTYAESGYSPKKGYKETNGTISAGLLQIDYYNANAYCSEARSMGRKFTHKDMLNPELNLECGIHILQQQLTARRPQAIKKIGKGNLFVEQSWGDSTNWSVLKLGRNGNTKVLKQFRNHLGQLPFCSRDKPLPRKLTNQNCSDEYELCVNEVLVGEMDSDCSDIYDSKIAKAEIVDEAEEEIIGAPQLNREQ